MLWKK